MTWQPVVVVVNRLPLLKFCPNEMDRFFLRLSGSKPLEMPIEVEKHKSKSKRDEDYFDDVKHERAFQES